MKKNSLIVFFLLLCTKQFVSAQEKTGSLDKKSYTELQQVIDTTSIGKAALPYLKAYLDKAKTERQLERLFAAYENYSYCGEPSLQLYYADSVLQTAKKISSKEKLGAAYEVLSIVNHNAKNYKKALDYLLIADRYAYKSDNTELKFNIKYGIANIKLYLGFYNDALILYKECADYYEEKSPYGYINCLESIANCYNKLRYFDEATKYNELALAEARKINYESSIGYYYYYEGINLYGKKQYQKTIEYLYKAEPTITELNDIAAKTISSYYIGRSYKALGDNAKAIVYFKKTDESFNKYKYFNPDLRSNYELLINEAKRTGNTSEQLYYINQLMRADSLLNTDYKYLSGKMYKEYDTKLLIAEKNRIERQLAWEENISHVLYIIVGMLFITVITLLYRYLANQRKYKQRFKELLELKPVPVEVISNQTEVYEDSVVKLEDTISEDPQEKETYKKPVINPEVVTAVLKQLARFEEKSRFTQKDITLSGLAASLGTNSSYLSKIINHHKGTSFTGYLNDLRINYITELLKNEPRFRNFTMKALAEEGGFSTPQHFSKAFFAKNRIYPSFFISELDKAFPGRAVEF